MESSHNSVHVALGFPMSTVPYAAFHPIFFLHHANVTLLVAPGIATRSIPTGNKKLLGAPGFTTFLVATRNKKLLGAKGIATRSKNATSSSWHRY